MMCVRYRFAWFCLFSVSPFSCVCFVFFFLSWSATISTWRQALLSTIECQFSLLKPCEVYVSELLVWADAAVSWNKCNFVSFTMARIVWFLVTLCLLQRMWQQSNASVGVICSAGGRECGGISSTPQIALLSWKAQAQQGMCSILQGASVLQLNV